MLKNGALRMLNDIEDVEQIKIAVRKCIEKGYQDVETLEKVSNADFQSQYNYRMRFLQCLSL